MGVRPSVIPSGSWPRRMTAELAETAVDLDREVLRALTERFGMMTYVIRNTLVMGHNRQKWRPDLSTARVLRACRRLEARGHIEEVASVYAVQKCWAATPAGCAALTQDKEADHDGK